MTRIVVPAVMTLFVVVLLIGVNGWNRSGEPLQRVTVTERELPRTWRGRDNARFRIAFEGRSDPLDARNWLTEDRLRALGFVFDVMPGAPEAGDTIRRLLPKTAWVAFQYDGEAWRDIDRRRQLVQPAAEPEYSLPSPSHLVAVDASLDRDELLRRYPTGHLVIRASIQIWYIEPSNKGPLVYGYIGWIIPDEITIPREFEDRLRGLDALSEKGQPRYEVDVAVGKIGVPYVTDIRRLQ